MLGFWNKRSLSRTGSVLRVSFFTGHPQIEIVQGAQGNLGTQNADVDGFYLGAIPQKHQVLST